MDGTRDDRRLGGRQIDRVRPSPAASAAGRAGRIVREYRILVADDERDTREFLREAVARLGHEALAVEDGRQVVEVCRAANPGLVIADIHMPYLDGIAAAVEVNRERSIPFILVTGYHDPETLARAGVDPVMAYLVKPLKEAGLVASIAVAVARFEQWRAMREEAADLRQALEERKLVERAKGVLMRRLGIDEAEAYHRLRKRASEQNRKLAEVAREVAQAEEVFSQLGGAGDRRP